MSALSLRVMATASCVLLAIPVAQAHPRLMHAEPAAGSTVATSPVAIRLMFNIPIEGKFSRIRLVSSTGEAIRVSNATVDAKEVIVAVSSPLAAGDYAVEWRVVGIDIHWKAGRYVFRIKQ